MHLHDSCDSAGGELLIVVGKVPDGEQNLSGLTERLGSCLGQQLKQKGTEKGTIYRGVKDNSNLQHSVCSSAPCKETTTKKEVCGGKVMEEEQSQIEHNQRGKLASM